MTIAIANIVGSNLLDLEGVPCYEGPLSDLRTVIDRDHAHRLVALVGQRVKSYSRVGIMSNHRIETYVSAIACVSAGVTFVPLNPKFPVERLQRIVDLAEVDLILSDDTTHDGSQLAFPEISTFNVSLLAAGECSPEDSDWLRGRLLAEVSNDAIAYMMFTSGSTGDPKGVPVSYESLSTYISGITERLEITEGLRYTQFFDLSFDLSIHDIFLSQFLGGTLVAPKATDFMMPAAYIARESIDVWFSVPVLGAVLGRAKRKVGYNGLQHILFCGEALPIETVQACRSHLADRGKIWNLYGPTEATIAFTAADVTETEQSEGTASIGTCFGRNTIALFIGNDVNENPQHGDEGELLLGGPQVFAGYCTPAPSPFVDGEALTYYKSGDLVRYDNDGIIYRGRTDSQIKWRGYRIELGEIENAVRSEFNLKTVAAVLSLADGEPAIQVWCLASECTEDIDLDRLESKLPDYMIPARINQLDVMPVNVNGKIDRKLLSETSVN
jgi:D-alanine--poly(phosphoribitol) ligase subunit 1